MRIRRRLLLIFVAMAMAACSGAGPASQPTPVDPATSPAANPEPVPPGIAEYFATDEFQDRQNMVSDVAAGLSLDTLSADLHGQVGFPPGEPGRSGIAAPIGYNQHRQVVIRTPAGYTPDHAWPLIVLYHTWGGSADHMLDRLEMLMGDSIEQFVVAAPDDYRQTVIDAPPPITSEHTSIWRTVRSQRHIDSDRIYLVGYSLGGETVMTMATLHPGLMAGVVAMAAGYAIPSDVAGLWERFLPNLSAVPVLHTWGADDTINIVGLNGRRQDITLAGQNERLTPLIESLGLERYAHIRLDGVGHQDAYPPPDLLDDALSISRGDIPRTIHHVFRFIHQAAPYWVEGNEWLGEGWFDPEPLVAPADGEDPEAALARTIHDLLGEIRAGIDGQVITIDSTHLADLTIWISDGMIDWSQPVQVVSNGMQVFDAKLDPDVAVALEQAYRTYDFDNLRLAGIRIDVVAGTAHAVTADDVFPDLVREISIG